MRPALIIGTILALSAAGQAVAQSITVTKPAAGDNWQKGTSHTITWTMPNFWQLPVSITLVNPADTATVKVITTSAQNTGSYLWASIPADIPAGSYRIKVVILATASGKSVEFTISAQGQGGGTGVKPADAVAVAAGAAGAHGAIAVNPVRILQPTTGSDWKLGQTFMINWTANTKPDDGFTVDLLRADGSKVRTLLDGGADKRPDGSWLIWGGAACNDPPGDYRVRVTSWYAKKGMTSGLVHVTAQTKRTVAHVPVQVQNAELVYSNCGASNVSIDCEPPGPTRAAVGHAGAETSPNFGWSYFRARLTFDLAPIKAKHGVVVESATLLPGDQRTCLRNLTGTWCVANLVLLRSEEVGTWSQFKIPANMVTYPLVGWWQAPMTAGSGADITEPVRQIIKGAFANHGFVVTGAGEGAGGCATNQDNSGVLDAASCSYMCITHFTPIMYVTYTENLCDQ